MQKWPLGLARLQAEGLETEVGGTEYSWLLAEQDYFAHLKYCIDYP